MYHIVSLTENWNQVIVKKYTMPIESQVAEYRLDWFYLATWILDKYWYIKFVHVMRQQQGKRATIYDEEGVVSFVV